MEERRDARDAQDEFRTATERRDREKDELGMMKTTKAPDERKEGGERETKRERQSRERVSREKTDVV